MAKSTHGSGDNNAAANDERDTATPVDNTRKPLPPRNRELNVPITPLLDLGLRDDKHRRATVENSIKLFNSKPKVKQPAAAQELTRQEEKPQSVEPSSKTARVSSTEERSASSETSQPSLDVSGMPDEVRQRFIQRGRKYHFPDGTRAFTDRGKRLTTPSENTEVIGSLIHIARARRWSQITVTGSERFRKETWMAAQLAGLKVYGYKPTEQEQELVIRRMVRQQAGRAAEPQREVESTVQRKTRESRPVQPEATSASSARSEQREPDRSLIVGRLIDHGPAYYRHNPKEAMSYVVRLETARGETEVWGVDFERALKESASRPQIGDQVGVRSLGYRPVTVNVPVHDDQGRVTGEKKVDAHRNRWIVEQMSFLNDRAAMANVVRNPKTDPKRAVQKYPALAGTYLGVHAAKLAAKMHSDPAEQKRFVEMIRASLADSVERGEPMSAVRMRERARAVGDTQSPRTPDRDLAHVR